MPRTVAEAINFVLGQTKSFTDEKGTMHEIYTGTRATETAGESVWTTEGSVYPHMLMYMNTKHQTERPMGQFRKTCPVPYCLTHWEVIQKSPRKKRKREDGEEETARIHPSKCTEDEQRVGRERILAGSTTDLSTVGNSAKCGLTDPCRIWNKCKVAEYGQISFKGSGWKAHVLSYELEHGNVPEGLCVRHLCGNSLCVEPTHLTIGTAEDNARDKAIHGTSGRSLDDAKAREIWLSKQSGTQKERAEKFNVPLRMVQTIDGGYGYNSITGLPVKPQKRRRVTIFDDDEFKEAEEYIQENSRVDNHGCWIWQGGTTKSGYGYGYFKGVKYHGIHRLSLRVRDRLKENPNRQIKCRHGNVNGRPCPRACVNPAHLSWGSAKNNAQDRKRDETSLTGERNPSAKLTQQQVNTIRKRGKVGTYLELAEGYSKEFGFEISRSALRRIITGKTWKTQSSE